MDFKWIFAHSWTFRKTWAVFTQPQTKGHICVWPTILSKSLSVSERDGGGEVCSFSIRLLFLTIADGVVREILFCETLLNIQKSFVSGVASRAEDGTSANDTLT